MSDKPLIPPGTRLTEDGNAYALKNALKNAKMSSKPAEQPPKDDTKA